MPRLKNRPNSYLVFGARPISELLGVSVSTMYKWYYLHGLPIAKTPSGKWVCSKGIIDAWIIARNKIQKENTQGEIPSWFIRKQTNSGTKP